MRSNLVSKRLKSSIFTCLLVTAMCGVVSAFGWYLGSTATLYASLAILGLVVLALLVILAIGFYVENIKPN